MIVCDHLPVDDFLKQGKCFAPRPHGTIIDTIILHSCCVDPRIKGAAASTSVTPGDEEVARSLALTLCALPPPTTPALKTEREDLEFRAASALILARRGKAGLEVFSREGMKDVFELLGVSAHFLIDREGAVVELVDPLSKAFHAGASRMPRPEDGRSAVNDFSIGIELLANASSGYTDSQYRSLGSLCKALISKHPIRNVYGHCHIAPERKIDPIGLDWRAVISMLQTSPEVVHFPTLE